MGMAGNRFFKRRPGFRRLYIFGAGGHGRELAWLAEQSWPNQVELVFLVDNPKYLSLPINGVPVRLLDHESFDRVSRHVIALGDPQLRRKMADACAARGSEPAILIHPRVEMPKRIDIGSGAVICANTVLTTNVRIGQHVHLNVGCTISHDVVIEEYSTISPGVHVSGHVHIGRGVFIGTGANIINGCDGAPLVVGDGAVIAAGACVTESVEPNALMAGVPAVRKR